MFSYTYCVLRYVHDPAAGEAINAGILFYAQDAHYATFLHEGRYGHLSRLFNGFNHEDYQRFLAWLERAVEKFQDSLTQSDQRLFDVKRLPDNAEVLARSLVPDKHSSFQWGCAGAGITRDAVAAAEAIFQRMVVLQRPQPKTVERRDDDDVWRSCRDTLSRYAITKVLREHTVETREFSISFDHAYKNEKWHAIQPLSFDYQDASSIREKAMKWMGYGVALNDNPEFSRLYLLLGAPELNSYKRDYGNVKSWLSRMPIRPILIEEDEVEDFARELASEMQEHNVLPAPVNDLSWEDEAPPQVHVKA